jgi:DNA invertase Pin-like site-specific DNA recombinase
MGVFAEFERAMIQERVRAGLARAKDAGKQLGRPRLAKHIESRIKRALATPGRPGVRKIAFDVGVSTVQRISAEGSGPFRRRKRRARPPVRRRGAVR